MLVFFGQPRSELHAHPEGKAMQAALLPLASATLISWLVIGPFSAMLGSSMPYHQLEPLSLAMMSGKVLSAPLTWITLAVIAGSILVWFVRSSAIVQTAGRFFSPLGWAGERSFGLEWVNRAVRRLVITAGEDLRELGGMSSA